MAETKKNNATKKDVEVAQATQKIPEEVKKPMSKFGKQEVYEASDGTKYTFQFPGVREAQRIIDETKNGFGVTMDGPYNEQLWKNVIVEPTGITWEYWDEHDGYRDVMNACDRFLGTLL